MRVLRSQTGVAWLREQELVRRGLVRVGNRKPQLEPSGRAKSLGPAGAQTAARPGRGRVQERAKTATVISSDTLFQPPDLAKKHRKGKDIGKFQVTTFKTAGIQTDSKIQLLNHTFLTKLDINQRQFRKPVTSTYHS